MAVLRSYYWLCALPGASGRNPLGVSTDKNGQSSGGGLLTLGPHLIARYTFSNQKQIGGWSSKDFITCPAVYDENEKSYVCVFNDSTIKIWNDSIENLDKVKKIKFSQPIIRLISDGENSTALIFKDGSCANLSYAIMAKKNLETADILEKDETIINAEIFIVNEDKFICYITKTLNSYCIITCQLEVDINTLSVDTLKRVYIQRQDLPDARIIGHTLSVKTDNPHVHIMWSDGRLFAVNLIKSETNLIGSVPYINSDNDVSMVWIGEDHLAIYGADMSQEGALLIVFNVLFGVVSYRYPLKMHCPGARVWCLPDNLILESHQHLAIVPYVLSSHRNTLSLIGSNRNDKEVNKVSCVDWGSGAVVWDSKEQWDDLAIKGVSERDICLQYFPTLIEKDDIKEINKTIKNFTDIPEDVIVDFLTYIIKKFDLKYDDTTENYRQLFTDDSEFKEIMNSVLSLSFVRESMISHLKHSFGVTNTIIVLKYITFVLSDNTEKTDISMEFEEKLLLWSSCLIDSHFQEFLLSKDSTCRDILELFKTTVDDLIEGINQIESVLPILQSTNTMNVDENICIDDMSYYIEDMKLY